MHALVVADGDPPDRRALDAAWPGWADDVSLVVAADGGARTALAIGFVPDLVTGDLDSLDPATLTDLERRGVAIERAPVDKDETDTELALSAAARRGATRLTIVGAMGGPRVDHELANVALLAMPALADRRTALLDPRARICLIQAPTADGGSVVMSLPGPEGVFVSLIPWSDPVDGITTHGLRYPLDDESLPAGPARGVSNVRLTREASVTVRRGRLLVVEGPATLGR